MKISSLALNMTDLSSTEIKEETRAGAPPAEAVPAKVPTLRNRIAYAETQAILGALENTDWNRKQAARLLAISYRGLLYKIRRHNIVRGK
jgi:transcriptional regulator with GAF, ATPase, and Fis domain